MLDAIRERVWLGRVLIRVVVEEPYSIGKQEYLLQANRLTYLPLYLPEILRYFQPFIDHNSDGQWWFEYENTPLSISRPIGLLFDQYIKPNSSTPWVIKLRRGDQPNALLLDLNNIESLKTVWVNAFKESAYIRDGNAKAVMSLSKEDQEILWQSFTDADAKNTLQEFWTRMGQLLAKTKTRSTNWSVPVRVYDAEVRGKTSQLYAPSTKVNTLGEAVVSHGILLPQDLTLGEIYFGLVYPDGFLHLVCRKEENSKYKIQR
ncbi:Atg5 protein [Starmerella bacillaris]|uniref:Autophagy protein 5 n=1 Tax=Starmerella bacillaris TaxID=1247836 RepID=A0AAV5RLT3_STABA|nr:Atg5 protein [Starmerella bacillaris]